MQRAKSKSRKEEMVAGFEAFMEELQSRSCSGKSCGRPSGKESVI